LSLSTQKISVTNNLKSLKSDNMLYGRFEKDFTAACIKLGVLSDKDSDINSNSLDLWINFDQMSNLYLELGLISQNITKKEQN
jgi:hypothetical protein